MKDILTQFKYTDFIDNLDPILKNAVYSLEAAGVSIDTIGGEIASMPALGMTTKGANNWDKTVFQKVLSEVARLICTAEAEDGLTKQLKTEAGLTTQVIIAVFSGYIGDKLGFAAALCTPFVVLAIALIIKAGLNVFCDAYKLQ